MASLFLRYFLTLLHHYHHSLAPSSRGCVDDCCIVWNLVGNLLDESFTDPSDLLTPNYGVIYNRKVAARHSGNK